jgi:diguanylate cyclase (GGDEF)-like protein
MSEASWLRKRHKILEKENAETRALLEFAEISRSGSPDEALEKYLDYLKVHFSPTSEIKLYTQKAQKCLEMPIENFLELEIKPEDIILKIKSGFKDLTKIPGIIKETIYMMVVGRKPVMIDDTSNPYSYLKAHRLIFESMTKRELNRIYPGNEQQQEAKLENLLSLVGRNYSGEDLSIKYGEEAQKHFYERYVPKIIENIDAKMGRSVRKSHYTCPIIIEGKVLGDIHISHERDLSKTDCKTIDDLAYYVSIQMRNILASTTDSLTQLCSRAYLERELPRMVGYNMRHDRKMAVIMMDIDNFKDVNDGLGHQFGDAVLKEIGGIVNSSIKEGVDLAARYGGEEIIIFMPETSSKKAYEISEMIRKKIAAKEIMYSGKRRKVTVSSGIGMSGQNKPGLKQIMEETIHDADVALYYSKESGKDMTTLIF